MRGGMFWRFIDWWISFDLMMVWDTFWRAMGCIWKHVQHDAFPGRGRVRSEMGWDGIRWSCHIRSGALRGLGEDGGLDT
jgi:hypothetical protein